MGGEWKSEARQHSSGLSRSSIQFNIHQGCCLLQHTVDWEVACYAMYLLLYSQVIDQLNDVPQHVTVTYGENHNHTDNRNVNNM